MDEVRNIYRNISWNAFRIMGSDATKVQVLLNLAQRGPVRARDLAHAGIPRTYLKRLCDSGQLERVDRGLYRLAHGPVGELGSLAEVS